MTKTKTRFTGVKIEASQDDMPSFGASWRVTGRMASPSKVYQPGALVILYLGYDLGRAVQSYERNSGQRLSDEERSRVSDEAESLCRGRR